MNQRIKQLRLALGLTQEELGESLGISKSGVSAIESGTRSVTEKHILLLQNSLHINPDWLRTGEGEMRIKSDSSLISQLAKEYNLNTAAQMLLTTFLGLESGTRDAIIKFMQDFASQLAANNVSGSSVVSPQPNFNDLYTNPLINQHRCIPNASDKAIPDEKNA